MAGLESRYISSQTIGSKTNNDARYATGTDKFVVHLVHNSDPKSNHPEWEPASFVERIVYTSLTTIISGVGFALLIVSALVIRGSSGGFRIGVLWGIGGFAAFILAPAVGLPPELPGMMKAELIGRQFWWLGTAIVTATGLWILVFYKNPSLYVLAFILLLAPRFRRANTAFYSKQYYSLQSSQRNSQPSQ